MKSVHICDHSAILAQDGGVFQSLLNTADKFGGADGTGKYAYLGNDLDISLTTQSRYLGFWWSAGSGGNQVAVYDNASTLLGSFDTTDIMALIGTEANPKPVLASDGKIYSGKDYYGNPNAATVGTYSPLEPFAYVNLRLDNDSYFGEIKFSGANFEFDNVTVSPEQFIPGAPVAPDAAPGPVPFLGSAAAFAWSRRLRRRIQQAG